MAVKSIKTGSSLNLKIKTGLDAKGNDVVKNMKFSKVKVTATDEQIKNTADIIGTVLHYPVMGVSRVDSNELIVE